MLLNKCNEDDYDDIAVSVKLNFHVGVCCFSTNILALSCVQIREGKVKILTPREAGYAIQLSNKPLLDVRPASEREKVVN